MPDEAAKDVRILSLDGGGSWAILQAMALHNIYEDDTGHDILSRFDLAVANSGGSIVLALLLLNWRPSEIRNLFSSKDVREDIFVKNFGPRPHGNRYKASEKQVGFSEQYVGKNGFVYNGTALLGDIVNAMHKGIDNGRHCEVVITGFDYDEDRSIFFKSSDGSGSSPRGRQKDRRHNLDIRPNVVSLVDACHVATNAPVLYFDDPAYVIVDGKPLRGWDGAIGGYNNPILAGITEALTLYKCKPEDLKVLSIGTANVWQPMQGRTDYQAAHRKLFRKREDDRWSTELTKLAKSITGEPPASATYVAAFMLGYHPPFDASLFERPFNDKGFRLVRLNPMIQPEVDSQDGRWHCPPWAKNNDGSDDIGKFIDAVELDMDAIEEDEVELIIKIGNAWLKGDADNQLIVSSGATHRRRGFKTYSEARDAWLAL